MCLFLVGDWFSFLEISLFNGKGVELRLQRVQYIDKIQRNIIGPWLQESHGFMEAGASPAVFQLVSQFQQQEGENIAIFPPT